MRQSGLLKAATTPADKDLLQDAPDPAPDLTVGDLYGLLLESPHHPAVQRASRQFLNEQLAIAATRPHDFPADPRELESWMERRTLETGARYADYLARRRQGAPRRYFSGKAHALFLLQKVAPTKLVDGAWLYGILPCWSDSRMHGLVRTYLEELGDGLPEQNHVLLYQQLLAANGCEMLPQPADEDYVRGAIQLALACNTPAFLPEVIGYNLGYEQLPLHLLITAFELGELGIDPYYFTLHVTVDNAATGHARRAVHAARACAPVSSDPAVQARYWQRILNGYRLSDLGQGISEIVESFDPERELVRILEQKRTFGQFLHSDYVCIGARTVNEWLSSAGQMDAFLKILEEKRWIIRHRDPQESRFWRLIDGPHAPMAGVFTGYEKQLWRDWILGNDLARHPVAPRSTRRTFSPYRPPGKPASGGESALSPHFPSHDVVHHDVNALRRELLALDRPQRLALLIRFMSPALHTTPVGLYATRRFTELLDQR